MLIFTKNSKAIIGFGNPLCILAILNEHKSNLAWLLKRCHNWGNTVCKGQISGAYMVEYKSNSLTLTIDKYSYSSVHLNY